MEKGVIVNEHFQLASDFVNTTSQHLYLTGKAGTGKTTFLQYIRKNSHKKLAVAAPTGVAAMNAGGVTLHSLFQLPLGGFIPPSRTLDGFPGDRFFDRKTLLKHLRLTRPKRELIRELELLIIDEVSMLRADLLDAIDTILRSVRKSTQPFGGIQMLFIGDLFQLPPVVNQAEWQALQTIYPSLSFFHAKALEQCPPLYLELKHIYRQKDQDFIDLLNHIRNDEATSKDLALLQEKYKPDFQPKEKGEYITLTTHNSKADVINREELDKLSGKLYRYTATVSGDFNEATVMAETELQLKEGAQVMFIRNDKGDKPRYYNGKLAIVESLESDKITVSLPENNETIVVEKEIWENKRYKLNKETDTLEEDVKGTFTQFPLRLAWAITIHKSQGLTFDKAIIDAGSSFAPGQVYVALSRLRSLNGLVLRSPITESAISSDPSAIDFCKQEKELDTLQQHLQLARIDFIRQMLLRSFDWTKTVANFYAFMDDIAEKRLPEKEETIGLMSNVLNQLKKQKQTATKFQQQLQAILQTAEEDHYTHVNDRVQAAEAFFRQTLEEHVATPLQAHYDQMKLKAGIKKYLKLLREITLEIKHKLAQLAAIATLTKGLAQKEDLSELFIAYNTAREQQQKAIEKNLAKTNKKQEKGDSKKVSLQLYKEGKSVDEIAAMRSLSPSTVESHLVSFVGSALELDALVTAEKAGHINTVIDTLGNDVKIGGIKAKLGDEYTYTEIRAVLNDRYQKLQTG